MKKSTSYFFYSLCLLAAPCSASAQKSDTLAGVKVLAKKPLLITTSTNTLQQLNKTTLSKLNSVSVADAVKYFSGVVVKDYGGIGGLKTISVRSLGANHTAVLYDGISVGDAQGGQIDLGRFSLENIETIELAINQPTEILMPARSFASASVLMLSTPELNSISEKKITIKLSAGSFGYINPVASFRAKHGKHFIHSLFGEYQHANGAYPYKDYETGTTKPLRNNGDIKAVHAEYDAAYYFSDSNKIKFKAYYYNSKRGLPGSVIINNPFSSQRLNNESFFSQFSWKKSFSSKSNLLVSGKYASDYKYYLDPSYPNNLHKLENEFHQKELYVSAAWSYKLFDGFYTSFATDYFHSKLIRTDQFDAGFANPSRNNFLENISIQYRKNRLQIDGNVLYTKTTELTQNGMPSKGFEKLTPAVGASFQLFKNIPLRIRASYKQVFRVPTFDDLYYTNIGNTELRPELAKQYNAGITISLQPKKIIKEFVFTTDAYYNAVKDKILAVPRLNLFQWSMENIGKVSIKGTDVSALLKFKNTGEFEIASRLSYTFQQALDISNPANDSYKTQLPYTPKHSGSATLMINYKSIAFSYNVLSSSYRYRLGEQDAGNLVQNWATQDISLIYNLEIKKIGSWQFIAALNNIFNQQYEIIKYYPMPGFNYRLGIVVKLK